MADQNENDDEQLEDQDQDTENLNGAGDEEEDEGEVIISLGDAAAPAADGEEEQEEQEAPKWVKEVRNENRELKRELRELRKQQPKQEQEDPEAPVLGDKPKLADHEFDEDLYQAAIDAWYVQKAKVDDYQAAQKRKQEEVEKSQQQVMTDYQEASKKLRVSDFKEVEDVVADTLTRDQQGLILNGADNPARLIYALGKSPEKLKELAAIANPVKFAFAVSKLERDIKVTKRDKPNPETPMSRTGSASRNTSVDKTMERLEEEAERTGDRTKIAAYRAQLRKNGQLK